MPEKMLKITLTKSINHRSSKHQKVLEGLGLRKIRKTVIRPDNAAVRGMVRELSYLLKVEEA